jgi:hypothetical protein
VTYGLGEGADVRASDVRLSLGGTEFKILSKGVEATLSSPLVGRSMSIIFFSGLLSGSLLKSTGIRAFFFSFFNSYLKFLKFLNMPIFSMQ